MDLIGGRLPVLLVDDVLGDPHRLRAAALALEYGPPTYAYPGKVAAAPAGDASLGALLRSVLALVNREYLPRIPPIDGPEGRISAFARVETDFAITDVHPGELTDTQRRPHTDPVPIFGLIYLNPEERGGTLFFDRPRPAPSGQQRKGYCSTDDADFPFVGRIEGRFNRLAVYPGFVPHTGEIAGSWIEGDERFSAPRLTQRLVFFP